ncbi:MAG: hypothetical protein ABII93_04745 [Chrysiogenia bacterium]
MGVFYVFACLALACVVWAVVTAIRIAEFLDKRGLKTPFPFWGFYIFRNLGRYREVTIQETGKVGPLYLQYVIPINAALLLALVALSIRFL